MEVIFMNIKILKPLSVAVLVLGLSQSALAMENPANKDLLTAATKGDLTKVEDALNRGADINCTDWDGRVPLHLSSKRGYQETVKLLLEHGADVDCTDKYGRTALDIAKKQGYKTIVHLIASEPLRRKRLQCQMQCQKLCNPRILEFLDHNNQMNVESAQLFATQTQRDKQGLFILNYVFDFLLIASDILLG
jgi:hypothetical protein